MKEDRSSDDIGHIPLSGLGDVITNFVVEHYRLPVLISNSVSIRVLRSMLNVVVVEPFNGINIGEPKKWSGGRLEVFVELFNQCR